MFVKEGLKKCGIFHTVDWTLPPPPYFIVKCGIKTLNSDCIFFWKVKSSQKHPKEREREKKRERESSVNIPIIELQSTLSTYQLMSYRGLCQHTENGDTEWLLFLNLSTLSTYQNYSYRVLCEVCCIWVTEYSVSYGKIDLQSNL